MTTTSVQDKSTGKGLIRATRTLRTLLNVDIPDEEMGKQLHIIALAGGDKSGKSTLANEICDQYPAFSFYDVAMALKSILTTVLMIPVPDEKDKDWRDALIGIGMAFREHVATDVWVKHLEMGMIVAYATGLRYVVVHGVRFKNEAEYIKKIGGCLVKLSGDGDYELDELEPDILMEDWDPTATIPEKRERVAALIQRYIEWKSPDKQELLLEKFSKRPKADTRAAQTVMSDEFIDLMYQ